MNNLLTAIFSKISGSSFSSDVGGRVYLDSAPDNCELPYCVAFIVSDVPDNTFTEYLDDILIQFSLFSASSSATEITTIYNDLKALFDDCTFTLSSGTLLSMERSNLTTMVDEVITTSGTVSLKHWVVDYIIKVKDL